MADDSASPAPAPAPPATPTPTPSSSSSLPATSTAVAATTGSTALAHLPAPTTPSGDRTELLSRARAFLTSPQVVNEDAAAKRRFLADKGLLPGEITAMLSEMPQPPPAIPPRTYPQLPASRVPSMLLAVARLFTWIAGGSTALLLVYFRFILPRLTESYKARHVLHSHQNKLFERFNNSLKELKDTQETQLDGLPRLPPFHEAETFAKCETVEAASTAAGDAGAVPDVTLLRCVLAEYQAEHKRGPTSEELFVSLETKVPLIAGDEKRRESLWNTLTTTPVFHSSSDSPPQWSHAPLPPPAPAPIVSSLSTLRTSLPGAPTSARHPHVLSALVDFTGYLTAQTYSFGAYGRQVYGGADTKLSPAADEVRREIRALKGLVLNRRSFMAPPTGVVPT